MEARTAFEAPASIWKRVWSTVVSIGENLDYTESDYLMERISELEQQVDELKARLSKDEGLSSPGPTDQ